MCSNFGPVSRALLSRFGLAIPPREVNDLEFCSLVRKRPEAEPCRLHRHMLQRQVSKLFDGTALKADPESQARTQAIADVITREDPDLPAICEAANNPQAHLTFIATLLPGSNYQIAAGVNRGRQNLVIYYRPPFQVVSVDDSGRSTSLDRGRRRGRGSGTLPMGRKPREVVFEFPGRGAPCFDGQSRGGPEPPPTRPKARPPRRPSGRRARSSGHG